jgi:hypothetical protein
VARNPEKSLGEFGIREGEKGESRKEGGFAIRELSTSGSGGCAQNDVE